MLNGRQAIESSGGETAAERSLAGVNDSASAYCLFTEGDDLYEAMLAAIGAAWKSVRLETYIFAADEVGWRFANALAEKARAGVDVCFHFDARGAATGASPELYQSDLREAFFHDLERSEEVLSGEWAKRGWRERLFETIGWMARKVL